MKSKWKEIEQGMSPKFRGRMAEYLKGLGVDA